MKSKSKYKRKILDTCVILNHITQGNLEQFITNLSKKYNVMLTIHVRNEIKRRLINQQPDRIKYFEQTLKKLCEAKIILMNRRENRLKKSFKELKVYLKNVGVRLSRVDKHIIALACQLGAEICSTDGGIAKAIEKIKKAKTFKKWRVYAEKVIIQQH